MTYRLTVTFGGRNVERREVSQPGFTIGRGGDCDLVIDNLGVSRVHAEITYQGEVPVVTDLNSNNGTFVNGRRVVRHNLNDGDEIVIGKYAITFHSDQHLEELPEESEPESKGRGDFTMAIDARMIPQRHRGGANLKGYLVIREAKSERTVVLDKVLFSFGKAEANDYRVGGFFTAKRHCFIVRDEGSFRLVDTSQKRRTFLNEMRIDDERLKDGDVIRVGRVEAQFRVGVPNLA